MKTASAEASRGARWGRSSRARLRGPGRASQEAPCFAMGRVGVSDGCVQCSCQRGDEAEARARPTSRTRRAAIDAP
eukprot:1257735-Alexandrium_andersonii.AAC.1